MLKNCIKNIFCLLYFAFFAVLYIYSFWFAGGWWFQGWSETFRLRSPIGQRRKRDGNDTATVSNVITT